MTEIKKARVYLFEDVPLEVIVIDKKGKILRVEWVQWMPEQQTLRFVQATKEVIG